MKVKITSIILILCLVCSSGFSQVLNSTKDVYPVSNKKEQVSLNGTWKFKYLNTSLLGNYSLFHKTDFDDASWAEIPVPGNWELNGFKTPTYGSIENVLGLYRKKFTLPANMNNKHIFVRFEGVEFGYQLWINGDSVGTWESSFNPCQFDITKYVNFSSENTIAVKEYTQPRGYKFDTNDDWALTGIDRDVEIFAVPDIHFNDITIKTDIIDNSIANINLKYILSSFSSNQIGNISIKGNLLNPLGKQVNSFTRSISTSGNKFDTLYTIQVTNPILWTAETPSLYTLDLYLCNNTDTLQHFKHKVGIREITINGNILSLNGKPIKLRGVNRHENDGRFGRAISTQMRLADLDLMKKANINFVRASHYPPSPDFVELCDSIGMYLMDEVPFGFGDDWLTDISYKDILKTRALATVMRDKNHASVIIWSVGNENPFTAITDSCGRFVQQLDPSRPICYPQYGGSSENALPASVNIFSTHYPDVNSLTQILKSNKRPFIATEYAHALGLAGENQKKLWDIMESSPGSAGGAVWVWADQSVLRKGTFPGEEAKTNHCWINKTQYYDANGDQGTDGIVNTDRTPQTDYWEVRRNYAQTVVLENNLKISKGTQDVTFTIKNKYDFVNLNFNTKCSWNLTQDRDTIQSGTFVPDCKPHEQITKTLNITIPNNPSDKVYLLHFDFTDSTGRHLYNHSIKLFGSQKELNLAARLSDIKLPNIPASASNDSTNQTTINAFDLSYNFKNGMISIKDNSNKEIFMANGPLLRTGRKTTIAENITLSGKTISKYLISQPQITLNKSTESQPQKSSAAYFYQSDEFGATGNISFEPTQNGWIDVNFELVPNTSSTKVLLDAGLSFPLNSNYTEFRWLGYGPYPSYPGKSALNDFGIHHLTAKDVNIQGNHSGINLALVTDTAGNGIAILCDSCNIDIDKTQTGLVVSYNSLVSGKGYKFSSTAYPVKASASSIINGHFQIIPVKGSNWPQLLKDLFGKPEEKVTPYRPYLAQYEVFTSNINDFTGKLTKCQNSASASSFRFPNIPAFAFDNNKKTYWSAKGDNEWLQYQYCDSAIINTAKIAFANGDKGKTKFDMEVSNDGMNWKTVLTNQESSGTTINQEIFSFKKVTTKYVRLRSHGSTIDDSIKISEIVLLNDTATAIGSKVKKPAISISPNPFNNYTTIEYTVQKKGVCNLSLFDINGKLIKTLVNNDAAEGTYVYQLEDNKLCKGVYFIKFQTANSLYESKIIKS